MSKVLDKTIETIRAIAQDVNNGDTIVREIIAQELRAVWRNTNTKKEYPISGNVLRRLVDFERNDPRLVPVLQFIANQITAPESIKQIDRLEGLKAFW
jgi:hypothetical protein